MNREQLFTFLLIHTWLMGSAICVHAIRRRSSFLIALLTVVVAALLPLVGALIFPDSLALFEWFAKLSRGHLPSAAVAVAVSIPWIILIFTPIDRDSRATLFARRWIPYVFACSFLLTIASFTMLMLLAPPVPARAINSTEQITLPCFDPRFEIQSIAKIDHPAIRLAVNEKGHLFVASTIFTGGNGQEFGVISEVIPHESGEAEVKVVAESGLLWRVYGLTVRGKDLFVSRSGRMFKAQNGRISYENAGVVTQLRDLNQDGEFDYYHDVVTGLPGSQGPEAQHQNNGLLFRPDGTLLICQGNTGNRQNPHHPWEGTILEVSPDFQDVSVYAEGLRNPFSLTFGPEGELFAIDQDWGLEGDELDHIESGRHYGHPDVVGMTQVEGYTSPLIVGAPESNLVSLAYANVDGLENSLLITDLFQDKVWQARLTRTGDRFECSALEEFAALPKPVDICVDHKGTIYVLSRSQEIYRIRLKQAARNRGSK